MYSCTLATSMHLLIEQSYNRIEKINLNFEIRACLKKGSQQIPISIL